MTIVNNIVTTNRIRALAEDSGLQLVLKDEPIACTSGTTIYLQRPSWDWTEEQLILLEGSTYHEIGHCTKQNKDIFTLIKDKGISMQTRLGGALNALDDVRQEYQQFGRYAGRDRVMGESNKLCVDKQIEKGAFSAKHEDESIKVVQCCLGYMTYKFAQFYPACSGDLSRIQKTLSDEIRDKIDLLIAHDHELCVFGDDAEGVYKKSLRLLELLGFDPEQEEQDAKDKKTAEEQLSDAAKAFAEEMFKHAHTDEDVEGREGEGAGTGAGEKVTHTPSDEDGTPHKHLMDTTDRRSGEYVASDWRCMRLIDYSKTPATCSPSSWIENEVLSGAFLGTRVKKLLQAMAQTRYRHGLKRGRISGKNLYRATMTESGGYQERVFKKKEASLDMDVVFSLVVDCSGSMGDDTFKYGQASASAIIMNKVLSQLGVDNEIVGFTETRDGGVPVLCHGVFKAFGQKVTDTQLNSNFKHFMMYEEQNLDGESIMWAAMRLLKRKAKRRIMIVFSDGQPYSYRRGSVHITRKVVKELEARKDMEIYGIGIQSDSVKDYYKDFSVIDAGGSLEQALLEVIKLKIINGDQTNGY